MTNTINIEFYNQLLDSMAKNIEHFNGLVDRERAAKEEAQRYAAELEHSVASKDAEISSLNGRLAQAQTGLATAEQEALANLAHKVELLNEAISALHNSEGNAGVLSPAATPVSETKPASEQAPAPEVEQSEESHDLSEADAEVETETEV
jgi:uncharacterized coiled-coil protein SlyX